MEQNQCGNKITEGIIWKQILIFFFPLLLGTFFQQLYNTMDAIVVGRFVGKEALSAVGGTTGSLIYMFVGFFVGLSSGATVIISQYYGAKNEKEVGKAVHTAIELALVGGAVITVVGILGAPTALSLMGVPEDIMPYSLTFIRVYFLGMTANLVYNMGAGILRAIGDSVRPLYFLVVSCFINIGLDLLFVTVFHLGVLGAALATVIAQIISAVLVCIALMRTDQCYRLSLRKIRFHKTILYRIIRIGLPAGFQSLMYTFSNIIIQSNINSFGTDTIAAWTAYGKIDGLFWMTMGSFGIAVTTFVGQNYGAGKYDRVHKGIRISFFMTLLAALSLSISFYLGGSSILWLFTTNKDVIAIGTKILRFLVPTYITYISVEILSGALRGMGNSLIPMIICLLGICALRVLWIFVAVPIRPEIKTVIFSYPLTWAVTSVLFFFYYIYYVRKHSI
jgi:putative efflux protein, MATE family